MESERIDGRRGREAAPGRGTPFQDSGLGLVEPPSLGGGGVRRLGATDGQGRQTVAAAAVTGEKGPGGGLSGIMGLDRLGEPGSLVGHGSRSGSRPCTAVFSRRR